MHWRVYFVTLLLFVFISKVNFLCFLRASTNFVFNLNIYFTFNLKYSQQKVQIQRHSKICFLILPLGYLTCKQSNTHQTKTILKVRGPSHSSNINSLYGNRKVILRHTSNNNFINTLYRLQFKNDLLKKSIKVGGKKKNACLLKFMNLLQLKAC